MSKISMDTIVELHNNGNQFKSMWDSKEVKINKGKHIKVVYGLALHFQEQDPDLEIKFIEPEPVEPREPENPLEENNRGEAFSELEGE
ncbi:hypothetical protein SAMN05877753_10211 [Bacillus oleivorans]|uniref:Uncharacterized protein n=1 Tax=Bacillus oleivorans TaxID=1448271 RepID=A0A285CJN8_9BACI|nr:hypothetical protein [Bacillus oleivorans]SNX67807.1 hypothetical protein SAMN05877753_10211 [Bacillus oleivorans]